MAFIDRLREATRGAIESSQDPWEPRLKQALEGVDAMSSVALLELVMAAPSTANARRLAAVMRKLGFIAVKNRRMPPGGHRDTVARGWTRPCHCSRCADQSRQLST